MTKKYQGEVYAILIALLESLFPIISIFILVSIEPLFTYALSITVANVVFVAIIFYQNSWSEFMVKEAWSDMLWLTFYITMLFILMLLGLQYTTAGNMSVIISLQLFFSYLYFNVFGSDKMTTLHSFGALLMGVGAIIILFPNEFSLNKGDALIFLAAMIAPLVSKHQQRARVFVSAKTILAFRNIIALPFVLAFAFYMERIPTVQNIMDVSFYIFLNGVLIFVFSKLLFVEALNIISITKLFAWISFMPVFTLLIAYFVLGEIATWIQVLGVVPIVLGSYFITK
ncbi:MAG: EamA family transporter [uncultured Sulfurovum sp.]|uniref:EamA family transporter n=1 Tax=uncultured Sulfurovum sp. TaxID=269237 RepID=A0A6S6SKS4_9BACT|nr:MAG: EamA family transporter [uncultured Sulfurovum sp.]